MLPLLEALEDGRAQSMGDITPLLSRRFKLTEEDLRKELPSGQQTVFGNRVGWARTYLKKAGLLESPSRGMVRISSSGKNLLAKRPPRIDNSLLMQFDSFREFRTKAKLEESTPVRTSTGAAVTQAEGETPVETLEAAYSMLEAYLADELLQRIKAAPPEFFERLVVRLLVRMGYGGSLEDAGKAVGRSGDGGVDGIIKEDALGLDAVYLQAKRWEGTVDRPTVQAFAGSLEGNRARKGVLITTSSFSRQAIDYVKNIEKRIVLIDGQQLAKLMLQYDVGVTSDRSFILKRIDEEFFEQSE